MRRVEEVSTLHEPVSKCHPNTNTHTWIPNYSSVGNRGTRGGQRLESHSEGDQAGGGGSWRGCDGRQGSRFQPVHGSAGNSDVIRSRFG